MQLSLYDWGRGINLGGGYTAGGYGGMGFRLARRRAACRAISEAFWFWGQRLCKVEVGYWGQHGRYPIEPALDL